MMAVDLARFRRKINESLLKLQMTAEAAASSADTTVATINTVVPAVRPGAGQTPGPPGVVGVLTASGDQRHQLSRASSRISINNNNNKSSVENNTWSPSLHLTTYDNRRFEDGVVDEKPAHVDIDFKNRSLLSESRSSLSDSLGHAYQNEPRSALNRFSVVDFVQQSSPDEKTTASRNILSHSPSSADSQLNSSEDCLSLDISANKTSSEASSTLGRSCNDGPVRFKSFFVSDILAPEASRRGPSPPTTLPSQHPAFSSVVRQEITITAARRVGGERKGDGAEIRRDNHRQLFPMSSSDCSEFTEGGLTQRRTSTFETDDFTHLSEYILIC